MPTDAQRRNAKENAAWELRQLHKALDDRDDQIATLERSISLQTEELVSLRLELDRLRADS